MVEFGGTQAGPEEGLIKMLRAHVESLFDDLKYDDIEEWLGHRPAITDSLPMLGRYPPTRNLCRIRPSAPRSYRWSQVRQNSFRYHHPNPTNLDLSPYRQTDFLLKASLAGKAFRFQPSM